MSQETEPQSSVKLRRVFISHSSEEQEFADLVQAHLQSPDISGWIDSEQIDTGDDILTKMGEGLHTMDILVVLISYAALESTLVALEVNYAIWREIKEKKIIVLPFIIDDTPIESIRNNSNFWHLGQRHLTKVTQDDSGARVIVDTVRRAIEKRSSPIVKSPPIGGWELDPTIEKIIRVVKLGQWKIAMDVAIVILKLTDDEGNNKYFQSLITSLYNLNEGDLRWSVIQVLESIAMLAPWLFDHAILAGMANHSDFTIRTVAANICMDFSQFAPDRVPLDIAFRLSRYDEDWYVMAPAVAALKSLVRPMPAVLAFFYQGLHDEDSQAREHASDAVFNISQKEPDLLDPNDLEREIAQLWRIGDEWSAKTMTNALFNARQSKRNDGYKYGI